jgi:hypothetical protein
MPLENFMVVQGHSGSTTISLSALPSRLELQANEEVYKVLEFELPAGSKSELSVRVLGKTPDTMLVQNSLQLFEITDSIDVIYFLPGLFALEVNPDGSPIITNVNESSHRFRSEGGFPSSVQGITVANNGQVSDTLLVVTIIRHPKLVVRQPGIVFNPPLPQEPIDFVSVPSFSISAAVTGKLFVEEIPTPPAEEDATDENDDIQEDPGRSLITDLDISLEVFRLLAIEVDSDTKFFLATARARNISAVTPTSGIIFKFFRVDPDLGNIFMVSQSALVIEPGQFRGVTVGLKLRTALDFEPIPFGTHTIRCEISSIGDSTEIQTDADTTNNARTASIKLLAPGEPFTVLPPPSTTGGSSGVNGNNLTPEPTGDQVNVVVDDQNSQSLYDIQPGDEFQSNYIETNVQAVRVAENIIWQKNQIIVVTFTLPYNPDLKRGQSVSLNFERAGFSILALVKSIGHTFTGDNNRGASTQVVCRATEYIFESSLAELGDEVLDRRQQVLLDGAIVNSSI